MYSLTDYVSRGIQWLRDYLTELPSPYRHLADTLETIDIKLLREYILYLLKRSRYSSHPYTPQKMERLSTATVHGHVRTLRAFFSWLVSEGLIESNITRDLKPPKVVSRVVTTLHLPQGS